MRKVIHMCANNLFWMEEENCKTSNIQTILWKYMYEGNGTKWRELIDYSVASNIIVIQAQIQVVHSRTIS